MRDVSLVIVAVLLSCSAQGAESPGEAFEKLRAAIIANRSAAASVSLAGRCEASTKVEKLTDEAWPKGMPRPVDSLRTGSFSYLGADGGGQLIWRDEWSSKDGSSDSRTHFAFDGNVTLDASQPDQGYLRAESSTDQCLLDFYQVHFPGSLEMLDELIADVRKRPELWTASVLDDGDTIRVRRTEVVDGKSYYETVEVRASWGFLPAYYASYNDAHVQKWVWKQDPESLIWFPSELTSIQNLWMPKVFRQHNEATYFIEQVVFNEPVAENAFTFASLGLAEGAIVYDMRTVPPTSYSFRPDGTRVAAALDGAEPIASAPSRSLTNWGLLLSVNAFLVALIATAYIAHRRRAGS